MGEPVLRALVLRGFAKSLKQAIAVTRCSAGGEMGEWRGSASVESCRGFYRSGVLNSDHSNIKVILDLSCFRSYENFPIAMFPLHPGHLNATILTLE